MNLLLEPHRGAVWIHYGGPSINELLPKTEKFAFFEKKFSFINGELTDHKQSLNNQVCLLRKLNLLWLIGGF